MVCVQERITAPLRASAQGARVAVCLTPPYSTGILPGISFTAYYSEREENGRKETGSAPAEGSGSCTTDLKYLLVT